MLKATDNQAMVLREEYLAEVTKRLSGRLSALEAFESIQEMRGHIDAMAAAYEELGLEPCGAMKAAIEKFGKAGHIGSAVAQTTPNVGPIGFVVGISIALITESVIGAALMLIIDLWFATHQGMNYDWGIDMAVGAGAGAVVALFGWFWRLRPIYFASVVCCSASTFLWFTLCQTFMVAGRPDLGIQTGVLLTAGLFLLAISSVRVSRYLKENLKVNLPNPRRPTTN
jgi:hypothetical protein